MSIWPIIRLAYSNARNRPQIIGCGDEPLCVMNHQLHRETTLLSDGFSESERRLYGLKASVTEPERFSYQDIRVINAAVEQRAPAREGLHTSAAPTRTLWIALWDTVERSVEIDFYLNERLSDAVVRIDRSEPVTFALA